MLPGLRFTMLILAVLPVLGPRAVAQTGAPSGALPIRLFAEAEDFQLEKGAWKVVPYRENYFASTFAISFLSRMACLGAPEQVAPGQEAVASQKIHLPAAGAFHVLARYEQPYNFSAEFTVAIEQDGKTVYQELFGRLTDPKIWALNGHQRVPMERYGWGGTDNIVWQERGTVRLARGAATLRLIAGPQLDAGKPRSNAARRHVDVLCLTNDEAGMEAQKKTNYLEFDGWLVQDGDLYVRVTNPKDAVAPCVPILEPLVSGQHSPYYVHVRDWPATRVLRSGRLVETTKYQLAGPRSEAVAPRLLAPLLDPHKFLQANPQNPKQAPALPKEEYLQPGETSAWVPLGQALDALNDSQWTPKALYLGKTSPTYLQLEFAVPDGKGGLRSVKTMTVKDETLEIPGNVAKNPLLRTQLEALRWLRQEVEQFPHQGRVPKRFPIYGILAFSGAMNDAGPIGEEATRLALALGSNTLTGDSVWAGKLGVPERKTRLVAHWPVGTEQKNLAAAQKSGAARTLKIVSYGDEIHIAPLTPPKGQEDAFQQKFAAWLRARNVPGAAEARFSTRPGDPWHYYSALYSISAGIEQYAAATKWLEEHAGKDVLTGANYSPHANYLVTELQWVRPFRMRAMTMPWSEDYVWQIPEFSVQVVGYQTSGLRAGARAHRLPIMMYVMPHSPGNTPDDFRRSFYTCVGHGAKLINYFCASPLAVGVTENYVATGDLPMWRALRAATHEAGLFEDYVLDGTVRPARVGLLLSSVDEILTGDTNFQGGIHNLERKAIYYALRHAQVPVDFLTEDDVIEGRAQEYQLLYVTQQFLHSRAVQALQNWAEAGGTVVALCGGGFFNEFGKANPDAGALYGAEQQSLFKDPKLPMVLPKQDLPPYVPLDTVTWDASRVPVLVWKQTLKAVDGKVRATYQNGSPAILEKAHGKGRALLIGFFPGMAYLKSGLPVRPADRSSVASGFSHFLPTGMDPTLRQHLVDDLLPAGFVRPVDCSEPLVESTCIDSPAKLAVPLINYTGKAIKKLQVRIPGLTGVKSIRSVEHGLLKFETQAGAVILTLPIDVADMLLLDR